VGDHQYVRTPTCYRQPLLQLLDGRLQHLARLLRRLLHLDVLQQRRRLRLGLALLQDRQQLQALGVARLHGVGVVVVYSRRGRR
jgi:hypothetical protein